MKAFRCWIHNEGWIYYGIMKCTWAWTFWWGLIEPGLHMTIPRLTSSLFSPLTRAPRLSPASARSRFLWNISIPAKKMSLPRSDIGHVISYNLTKKQNTHTTMNWWCRIQSRSKNLGGYYLTTSCPAYNKNDSQAVVCHGMSFTTCRLCTQHCDRWRDASLGHTSPITVKCL